MEKDNNKPKNDSVSLEKLSKQANDLGISLDEITEKIASLGLPGIVLVVTAYASMGSTPIITALTTLGGPFGVLGGLGVLGLISVMGDAVSAYGVEAILSAVYKERSKKENLLTLLKEIENLPLTDTLKVSLKKAVKQSEPEEEPKVIEIVED